MNDILQTIRMGELDVLVIQHPEFTAKIVLQGGHLIEFFTHHQPKNWLWHSQAVVFKKDIAIRGGVPICFPLFGNLVDNPTQVQAMFGQGLTKHGVARTAVWQLIHQTVTKDCVSVSLQWQPPLAFSEQYPLINLQAILVFEFSQNGFDITLESHNLGDQTLCFSQALHTYLPTDNIHQTTIKGFDDSRYIDMLQDKSKSLTQIGDIIFTQEVDRIYQSSPTITLATPHHQTTLIAENSLSTVIWNPWIDKSKTLDQFLPNDFEKMVCIETANAGNDFVTLAPRQKHRLKMSISKLGLLN